MWWAVAAQAGVVPIDVHDRALAPITFTRLVIADPTGIPVAESDERLRMVVLGALKDAGYDVRGGENLLFGVDDGDEASFLLGGTLTEGSCGLVQCKFTVRWELFDRRHEATIYESTTESAALTSDHGTSTPVEAVREGVLLLLARERFATALEPVTSAVGAGTWTGPIAVRACPSSELALPAGLPTVMDAVVRVQTARGSGSGVIVSPDGWILTAAHVVGSTSEPLEVVTRSGATTSAVAVRVDDVTDVALLRAPGSGYPCVAAAAAGTVGEPLYAIGSPLGAALDLSVSNGILSGFRESEGRRFLQTDASINPGNSGGPLLSASGAVVGIVSFKVSGIGIEGLGFGVPTEEIERTLEVGWSDHSDPITPERTGMRREVAIERVIDVDAPLPPRVRQPMRPRAQVGLGLGALGVATGLGTFLAYDQMTGASDEGWLALRSANAAGWTLAAGGGILFFASLGPAAEHEEVAP